MKILEIDCDLDPDVIDLLIESGKLRTREQIIREVVLASIDPIEATGPRFYFEVRPDQEDYISLLVPDCNDKVDLAVALNVAKLDIKACSRVLERGNSLEASLRVYINTLNWLKFLSVRHPNDDCRLEYHQQLLERRTGLEALRLKAGLRYRMEVLQERTTNPVAEGDPGDA